MVRNLSETDHFEHLGGLWTEMLQSATITSHLEHLGGLGPEVIANPITAPWIPNEKQSPVEDYFDREAIPT